MKNFIPMFKIYDSSLGILLEIMNSCNIHKNTSSLIFQKCFNERVPDKNEDFYYSRISNPLPEIFDFPPVGYANSLLQTKHLMTLLEFPKIVCSFLHLAQRTLINLLFVTR